MSRKVVEMSLSAVLLVDLLTSGTDQRASAIPTAGSLYTGTDPADSAVGAACRRVPSIPTKP